MLDSSFGHETGGNKDVWLHRLTGDAPRRGTIGPRPDHVVFRLADGSAELISDHGVTSKIEAGQPTMLSASVAYAFNTNATSMSLLHISASFLSTLSRQERSLDAPEFLATPTDPHLSNRLTALLDDLEERLLDPKLPNANRMKVNQRIATAVLSTFNQSQADAETRLRRAIRFAHDHAAEPIDVSDIAAAAGLSERGLQHLFRRSLDVTPMRYLREVRLDAAHLELTFQRPTTQSVLIHDVARRWQFFHLGRFAAMYRARFGQSPRESVDHPGRRATDSR
ncbi:helix-turn-helix transcriptional regulator [Curtobacterium flaccumfaciens]|uniref:helix-turn-helix transcriptional regulator n=1 Tax=Curtobacterium flaccumfaciens TaxID=2035 RepID=UPI0021758C61|nr:helix-turn-helix transcriptional regulator [Curtobacterium flaccumfaciens]MCS5495165.1 helix-turn-helix transcriptional regulator [Curtobacterium flaccumfaciens pv. flaccumfaciens]